MAGLIGDARVLLAAQQHGQGAAGLLPGLGAPLFLLPELGVEVGPALEGKRAMQAGGLGEGPAGGFDQERARAAEGVHQGSGPIPATEAHQTGGQVFFEGGQAHGAAVAPAMQAAAGAIQAEPGFLAVEVDMEGEIRLLEIDGGALPPEIPLQIDHGVFDL